MRRKPERGVEPPGSRTNGLESQQREHHPPDTVPDPVNSPRFLARGPLGAGCPPPAPAAPHRFVWGGFTVCPETRRARLGTGSVPPGPAAGFGANWQKGWTVGELSCSRPHTADQQRAGSGPALQHHHHSDTRLQQRLQEGGGGEGVRAEASGATTTEDRHGTGRDPAGAGPPGPDGLGGGGAGAGAADGRDAAGRRGADRAGPGAPAAAVGAGGRCGGARGGGAGGEGGP